jgi:SAM-dependent methyltransferase
MIMSEAAVHVPVDVSRAQGDQGHFEIASAVGMSPFGRFVAENIVSNDAHWAWQSYKSVVLKLQETFQCKSLLEVGAGRSPLLNKSEYESLGAKYTVNDISAPELALAPGWLSKVCFDISGPPSSSYSSYDLIFSKMVFEHVRDAKAAYSAVYDLLKPNGICLAFFPTLYCVPFLANYLSPERVSQKLLRRFAPPRNPKFPAFYSWCRSTTFLTRRLQQIGFREALVAPFYGHAYYRKIPLVRDINRRWTTLARSKDWRTTSSFAYVLVQK